MKVLTDLVGVLWGVARDSIRTRGRQVQDDIEDVLSESGVAMAQDMLTAVNRATYGKIAKMSADELEHVAKATKIGIDKSLKLLEMTASTRILQYSNPGRITISKTQADEWRRIIDDLESK